MIPKKLDPFNIYNSCEPKNTGKFFNYFGKV